MMVVVKANIYPLTAAVATGVRYLVQRFSTATMIVGNT